MAITFTGAGVVSNTASATNDQITITQSLAVGDYLVLLLAYDNSGGGGADPASGSLLNWAAVGVGTQVSSQSGLNDPGAASAGLAVKCAVFPITAAINANQGGAVTWGGASLNARAIAAIKVSSSLGAGASIAYRTNSGATGSIAQAATTRQLVTPTVNSGEGVLCWAGHENGAAITGDADTTNGTWSSVYGTFIGTGVAGMAAYFQSKVVTATATQTWDPTGASSDWIVGGLIFTETALPVLSQAAYRFYAEGTEVGSTALATQDTAYSPDVGGGDFSMQLRTRIQETGAGAVPITTNFTIQYAKNGGAWTDVSSDPQILTTYPFSQWSNWLQVQNASGQSFTGNGEKLSKMAFDIHKQGTPPGTYSAALYAHSGTLGTSSIGTGSPLAVSTTTIAGTALSGTFGWIAFNFDETFTLVNGTNYVMAITTSNIGDASNCVHMVFDSNAPTRPGNRCDMVGTTWTPVATYDYMTRVYTKPTVPRTNVVGTNTAASYDLITSEVIESAGTTQRLTGGSGAFSAAGTVATCGLCEGIGWGVGGFVELLYCFRLKQADLANGDALTFRVLRDGQALNTYAVTPTLNVLKTPPAITQAAYQFFDDAGTESGAAALAAQNTAVTALLTGADGYGQIRVRLQSTNAVNLPATDDWRLQWEKNASGTWNDTVGETLTEGYSEANQTTYGLMGTSSANGQAQSFLGNGQPLTKLGFYVQRLGSPTYNIYAQLWSHTGTFGTSGLPLAVLATSSNVVAVPSLSTSVFQWVEFTFSSPVTLTNGTPYCAVIMSDGFVDTSNCVRVGVDDTSPTHPGYFSIGPSPSWSGSSTRDLIFRVYTGIANAAVVPYDSPTLTESAATTSRLTGGTGTFTPGKVSEIGYVTNIGWSGNNYTELLYSVKLIAAQLADGDTLRFRVLRNGVTTGMTYTATPTVNVATPVAGQSVRFDAAGDKYTGSAPGAQSAYTMCAWVYPTTTAQSIMLGFDGMTEYSQLTLNSTNEARWWQETWNHGSGVTIPANTWAFVAVSANGATARTMYASLAGVSALTASTVGGGTGVLTAGDVFYIATNQFGDYPFNGRVAAVKIWTAALSEAELVAERGSHQAAVRTADLWAFYSFTYGPQTTDNSGNGRTLTVSGTPTAEPGPPLPPQSYNETNRPVVVASTITTTDTLTVASVNYNETGRSVVIVSATTLPVDKAGRKELALATTVIATVATPTEKANRKELALPVAVISTTTLTIQTDHKELARPVAVLSTVTQPVDQADLHETGGVAAVSYTDNFNRADGALGSGWIDNGAFAIAANRLTRQPGGGSDHATFTQNVGSADMFVDADLYSGGVAQGGGDNGYVCIQARNDGGVGQNAYMGFYNPTGDGGFASTWQIGKVQGGGYSDVDFADATGVGYPPQGSKLRLEVEGSTLRLYHDGVLKVTTTDTSITTGNYGGVNTNYVSPLTGYDNFRVGLLGGGAAGLLVPIVSTITITDVPGVGTQHYDETGRAVVIVSATATTDQADHKELARPVVVLGTTTPTDLLKRRELDRPVAIVSAVTPTDVLKRGERLLPVTIVSTTAATGLLHVGERDRPVAVISTVNRTDIIHYGERDRAVAVISATSMAVDQADLEEQLLAFTVASDVTSTDSAVAGSVNYNETGRLLLVVSTVSSTDQTDYDMLGLGVAVISTVTNAVDQTDYDMLGLPTAVISATTTVDQADFKDASAHTATATFAVIEQYGYGALNLPVVVASVVATTDQTDYDQLALPVVVASTVASTDLLKRGERLLPVAVISTTTTTDQADFKDPERSVAIVSGVTVTDNQMSPGHFDETNRPVSLLLTTTLPVDQTDYDQLAATLTVSGLSVVTTPVDQTDYDQLALPVAAVATTAVTTAVKRREADRPVAVVATVSSTDVVHWRGAALPVAAISTVASTDLLKRGELIRGVAVISTVATTDSMGREDLALPVAALTTVVTTDQADFDQLALPVVIAATIITSDTVIGGPVHYNETGKQINIVSAVAITAQADLHETVTVSAVAATSCTDQRDHGERSLSVTAASQVAVTSQADLHDYVAVSIVSATTLAQQVIMRDLVKPLNLTAAVTSTERVDLNEIALLNLAVLFGSAERADYNQTLALLLVSQFLLQESMHGTITVLTDALAIYLGDQPVSRIYVGDTQVWAAN